MVAHTSPAVETQLPKRAEIEACLPRFPQVSFNNDSVTKFGGFPYFELFKKAIDLPKLLKDVEGPVRFNTIYSGSRIVDHMVDGIVLGHLRVSHMDNLRIEPGFCRAKGVLRNPSERTIRRFIEQSSDITVGKLSGINRQILHLKSSTEEPREIGIDFDDSVLTAFGHQEGTAIGYNPRYHGRPSYKLRVGFVQGTKELVGLELRPGSDHSNTDYLTFFREIEQQLPGNWVLSRIRADRGFFDNDNVTYWEDHGYEYVVKAKMTSKLKRVAGYLDEQNLWFEIEDGLHAAELRIPLTNWERARRFVFIRRRPEIKDTQQVSLMDQPAFWDVQAMATNNEDLTPLEIWRWYNGRATIENEIEELKSSYGIEQNSHRNLIANHICTLLKAIAYNLATWFKHALLDPEYHSWELKTLRSRLLNIPGNIYGTAKNLRKSLPPWKPLQVIHRMIERCHSGFLDQIALRC
ncbi:MAG: IS1380 family transposase [Bacillota bacterium]